MAGFSGRIGHLNGIESPWGNAGGVVKTLEDAEAMARTGVGWIEAGSYTLEPRIGNSPNGERVYHHNTQTGETFNSLGMPNKGMDVVERDIPEMACLAELHGKKLVVNVAPVSDEPVAESQELVARAYAAGAHAVLLNAGCPNIITENGGRHELLSRNGAAFWRVVAGLMKVVEETKPIFVRLSPQPNPREMVRICRLVIDPGTVSAVFTPNTWPGHVPADDEGNNILEVPGGAGGLSGPATVDASADQMRWAIGALRGSRIDTISSGGIMQAAELDWRLQIGAVAAAGTTFYYESGDWKHDTDKLLSGLTA